MRPLISLLLLLGFVATAGASQGKMVDAYSGNPTYVYTVYALAPNCEPLPNSRIHFTLPVRPAHGQLYWLHTTVATKYPPSNPLHVCNNEARPGFQLLYKSDAGYKGPDKFTMVVTFPAGGTIDISRPITVH
jgi:hypothetical protein